MSVNDIFDRGYRHGGLAWHLVDQNEDIHGSHRHGDPLIKITSLLLIRGAGEYGRGRTWASLGAQGIIPFLDLQHKPFHTALYMLLRNTCTDPRNLLSFLQGVAWYNRRFGFRIAALGDLLVCSFLFKIGTQSWRTNKQINKFSCGR